MVDQHLADGTAPESVQLYEHRGTPSEYGAGLKLAIDRGWLWKQRAAPMRS
jgi:hypothetical protein